MSGSKVAPPPSIPLTARKVVRDLKEIVKSSDEEIYAMLKECNMDPNETVQRLINQDPFHEVKRKRDKKKENLNKRGTEEDRARPYSTGSFVRGGRMPNRGVGRGNLTTRYNSEYSISRDTGVYQATKTPSTSTASSSIALPETQPKPVSSGMSAAGISSVSGLPETPDGNSSYMHTAPGPLGNWSTSSGQATMADIVKLKTALDPSTPPAGTTTLQTTSPLQTSPRSTPAGTTALQTSASHQYIPGSSEVLSAIHSSSMDSVPHSFVDSSTATAVVGAIKREVGSVGNQRLVGDQAPSLSMPLGSIPAPLSLSLPSSQAIIGSLNVSYAEMEVKTMIVNNSLAPVSPSLHQVHSANQALVVDVGGSFESQSQPSSSSELEIAGSRAAISGSQHNVRAGFQPQQQQQQQQQHLGLQKAASGFEWKPKSPNQSLVSNEAAIGTSSATEEAKSSSPSARLEDSGMLLAATSKLRGMSIQDDQAVIIPNHLQVPETDRTQLSFGSFGADFGTTFPSSFSSEDTSKGSCSVEDTTPTIEAAPEQPSALSMPSPTPVAGQSFTHQPTSTPVKALASSIDIPVSMPAPVISQSTPDPVVQQNPPYRYLLAPQNYSVVPQIIGSQYSYEPTESQTQEVSRLSSFMQPYSDPVANYFSPVFRPGSDGDARYAQFGSKYTGSVSLMTGHSQTLPSSQEGGSNVVLSTAGPTGQTSQSASIAQATLTLPQQPLPMHAYPGQPGGVPVSPFATNVFGYQYVRPGYAYMHSPYPHNYTGNTIYPQPPAGSGYAPAAGSSYLPAGAAAVKYPLPQYKAAAAAGNAPHSAVAAGYGSYTAAPPGFAVGSAVTARSASVYDDVGGPQYKENNLYIPSQQTEGSAVWIQAQHSRDMSGMQTSSYYNMPGQGQHTGYAHAHTQPTHAHPAAAFGSFYHPSQSGPAPSAHQLIQQPQALGSVGAGSAQGSAYQQPNRGQLNWTNTYYGSQP